ncbi:MAG: hypothetical protein Q9216_001062 [Gyalolechia sp. 2 TL-2023]
MNNSQFRRLVMDTPSAVYKSDGGSSGGSGNGKPAATPTALGSRMRSNIPMTPRSLASSAGIDFARQLAERDAALNPNSAKKFRSSAAPKGTKLGSGYQDRTHLRTSAEEDEKASRVKALEEMVKLGQMERATFEALRDEIVGGDVKDVHLVKGLDYKLLERVRRGEDVLAEAAASPKPAAVAEKSPPAEDVDDEFEMLEEREFQPAAKQETIKKGEMAPPPLPPSIAGKKRTRDDILKELKASRQAAAAKAEEARQPSLSSKFHKIGGKQATSRIEIDARGREILITVDADGNVKRKVKRAKSETTTDGTNGLMMPDKDAKPLGLDVTVPVPQPPIKEQDDGDIFEGVGADYDPLDGELANDASPSESEDEKGKPPTNTDTESPSTGKAELTGTNSPTPDKNPTPLPKDVGPRNYFNESNEGAVDSSSAITTTTSHPLRDPTILAALKKASTLEPLASSETPTSPSEVDKVARRRRLLEAHDRDADDMDMGFGSSRFEDEEDGEGKRMKLSVWGGTEGEERGEAKGKGKEKRKRGPKKGKKGNKDSAVDVLKVLERRKGAGK